MPSRLTQLQHDVLEAFFARDERFYLSGGAALAGFHLQHRTTEDLDLFVADKVLDHGDRVLSDAAMAIGGTVEKTETYETFRRRLVRRGAESVVVDLVVDSAVQGTREKPCIGRIRVDPPAEILANKLCTLIGRTEIRDVVDVYFLLGTGLRIEEALQLAHDKDAGVTPSSVAWVISQIHIADHARLPANVEPEVLRQFLRELEERLSKLAFPA